MTDWNTILCAPALVINMKKCTRRKEATLSRLEAVGYTCVRIIDAIDASVQSTVNSELLAKDLHLATVRDPELLEYPGKIGCALSHIRAWDYIIENNLQVATVFEDDILFHTHFRELAQKYCENTPKDYDLMYIGSQLIDPLSPHLSCGSTTPQTLKAPIAQVPVWCAHAIVITLEGAKKLREWARTHGVYTLDHMIRDYMLAPRSDLKWYVWDATAYPDRRVKTMHNGWHLRASGLVFQDDYFPSFIRSSY